jgi:hypothetical protein
LARDILFVTAAMPEPNLTAARPIELRLADRLQAARGRRFVGRRHELELFRTMLAARGAPCHVLLVHGPGGVGKTALLQAYAQLAASAGLGVVAIDGRAVEPSPHGVQLALGRALGIAEAGSPIEALACGRRALVIIDTFEMLTPLEGWLREQLLPQLPGHTLVVIAGRDAPGPRWRSDAGWAELVRIIALRNLDPDDSREYLRLRGVPDAQHAHMLAFTHGHPLALSLVAEVAGQGAASGTLVAAATPDIVRVLLEKFIDDVPDREHRQALRVCAVARVTTEALLAAVLPAAGAERLFDWLGSLSFVEHGREGLFPHDLARDVLVADFRWRDPDGYWELRRHMRNHMLRRLEVARGGDQQRAFIDLNFLIRDVPVVSRLYEWRHVTDSYAEAAVDGDLPGIIEMVRRHEGPASARIAEHWFDRQPRAFTAIRGAGAQLNGFLALLDLHAASPADLGVDPGARAAWEFAHRHAPPRPGEELLIQRFWMDDEAYQGASVTFQIVSSIVVPACLMRRRLAWSFHPGASPDYWSGGLEFLGFQRCEAADFTVDGRRFGTYVRDWRSEPAAAWLRGIGERAEHAARGAMLPAQPSPPPITVLSEAAFSDAVRQALRDYQRPASLLSNPLLRSRVLVDRAGDARTPAALQALLREAAESLRGTPRSDKFFRAVERTYLQPAASQERAAEQLGLPFNTYRYQLARGIRRITEWLWARELGGFDG